MLDINYIIDNKNLVIKKLLIKKFNAEKLIEEISKLDIIRKKTIKQLENKRFEINKISKDIGDLFKANKKIEAEKLKYKSVEIKQGFGDLDARLKEIEKNINEKIIQIPNIPHKSVKKGEKGKDCCEIIKKNDQKITLEQNNSPHWDLVEKFNLVDFKLGNKITGSGFPVYINNGAKLQRSLINFFLEENIKKGYNEIIPPLLVNKNSAFGTGQLPDKDDVMYYIDKDDLYLIPTSEVPITNVLRNETLNISDLPVKYTSYTPCFRREAGSYGKDVRGLNRIHQFDKVEIVQISHPEESYKILEEMINHVESILIKLELPYRIIKLCGTDLSFTSALTYDFEVYSAAQKKWLEVSSISNFETFQSKRLKIKFKSEQTSSLCHTLNGSSLALPRIVAAILENNQENDKINIPKILHKYTGFEFISK
mgnify:CR=1 FL=1